MRNFMICAAGIASAMTLLIAIGEAAPATLGDAVYRSEEVTRPAITPQPNQFWESREYYWYDFQSAGSFS